MQPEFSRIIDTDAILDEVKTEKIVATRQECQSLAKRFNIEAINDLSAIVVLDKKLSGEISVKGDFIANIKVLSVLSLDPFPLEVKDSFKVLFVPDFKEDEGECFFDTEEDVEPLTGSKIDVGELVAEYFALAIPAFPKKDGETFVYKGEADGEISMENSPFAVLKKLK